MQFTDIQQYYQMADTHHLKFSLPHTNDIGFSF